MRYSVEMVQGCASSPPAIVLRSHQDAWNPEHAQVEIPSDEAGRHVDIERLDKHWRYVEFQPHRLSTSYEQLATLVEAKD